MSENKYMKRTEIIQGHIVEYHQHDHTYYVDGLVVPSVSDLCKKAYPNRYRGIDSNTLARAIKRGNHLHQLIETYETKGILGNTIEFKNYLKLKESLNFKVKQVETMVLIKYQDTIIACGRFDLLVELNGSLCLIDIKRTRELHIPTYTLQLNLYRYGLMSNTAIEIETLKILRLRDSDAHIVDIPIDDDLVHRTLRAYVKPKLNPQVEPNLSLEATQQNTSISKGTWILWSVVFIMCIGMLIWLFS